MNPDPRNSSPLHARAHVGAALAALALMAAALAGACLWAGALADRRFETLLSVMTRSKPEDEQAAEKVGQLERLKMLGTTVQRAAFARRDLLPLYGSSELVRPIPDKAQLFFHDRPTGFAVLPVGCAGTDCLLFLQDIAAHGDATAGSRVAISLSPSWFFTRKPREDAYLGNFSGRQALSTLLNSRLSYAYRQELARRFLRHPASLESDRLLAFLATRMAGRTWMDRAAYSAAWPLARFLQTLQTGQDRLELAHYIERRLRGTDDPAPRPSGKPAQLDWDRLIAEAGAADEVEIPNLKPPAEYDETGLSLAERDRKFRECVDHGEEWDDLELLLRGLRKLRVKTLVLCMPPQQLYYGHSGISSETLALFARKMRDVALEHGASVETFSDHENDPAFLSDRSDHLSNRGWMYYNRALDKFYHAAPGLLTNGVHGRRKHSRGGVATRDA